MAIVFDPVARRIILDVTSITATALWSRWRIGRTQSVAFLQTTANKAYNDIMNEWRPVFGFVNRYEVSSRGDIRSLITTDSRGNQRKPSLLKACHEMRKNRIVRTYVTLMSSDGRRVTKRVHTVVAETFLGQPINGQMIRHLDGNPSNNSVDNLAYGTAQQNAGDAVRHGVTLRGKKNHKAKIDEATARAIKYRDWGKPDGSKSRLAKELGVSLCVISDILANRTWAWL